MKRSNRPWRSPLLALSVALLGGASVMACSTDLTLNPTLERPPDAAAALMPHAVGLYISPELRAYAHSAEPYYNGHVAHFPVGSASATLFEQLLPRSFETVVPLDAPRHGTGGELLAVIEPTIEEVWFSSLRSGSWHYWSGVTYGSTVYAPDGEVVASWTVQGEGESHGWEAGETGTWSLAVERAMEEDAGKFGTSFLEVPEAKRWLDGRPVADATAATDGLATHRDADAGAVLGTYPGIVTVRAEGTRFGSEGRAASVRRVVIRVENLGPNRLLVAPSDIVIELPDGKEAEPAAPSFVAAWATDPNARMPAVAGGTGAAALPLLLFSLINAAAQISEQEQQESNRQDLEGEQQLARVTLPHGQSTEGSVYFLVSPGSGTERSSFRSSTSMTRNATWSDCRSPASSRSRWAVPKHRPSPANSTPRPTQAPTPPEIAKCHRRSPQLGWMAGNPEYICRLQ